MTRIEGQDLPEGCVNKVVGSLYGHPAAAFRAKQELHQTLTRDGMFKQTASDPNLYVLQRWPEVCWLPIHVDDMPVTGTPKGVAMTIKRLNEAFQTTVVVAPKRILGVEVERNWQTKELKIHQGPYTRKLLEEEQAVNCNPRRTPLEASVLGRIKQLQKEKPQGPLGKEKEYNQFQGKLMWLLKTRPDLFFCVCLMSRFLKCAGPEQMMWTR